MSYDTDPVTDSKGTFEEKFTVVLGDPNKFLGKYWVYDEWTHSIRAYTQSAYALTWDKTQAVITPYTKDNQSQKQMYKKENNHLFNTKTKTKCFKASENKEGSNIVVATCADDDEAQSWYPQYHYQSQGPHWNRLQNE